MPQRRQRKSQISCRILRIWKCSIISEAVPLLSVFWFHFCMAAEPFSWRLRWGQLSLDVRNCSSQDKFCRGFWYVHSKRLPQKISLDWQTCLSSSLSYFDEMPMFTGVVLYSWKIKGGPSQAEEAVPMSTNVLVWWRRHLSNEKRVPKDFRAKHFFFSVRCRKTPILFTCTWSKPLQQFSWDGLRSLSEAGSLAILEWRHLRFCRSVW